MKYGKNKIFKLEKLHSQNIDRLSTGFVPPESSVLEIGCATGFMGAYLINKKKCKVVGVEKFPDEAKEAKKVLTKVIQGDIEDNDTLKKISKEGNFDVILASAIIQHLVDPHKALKSWKKFFKKNGRLVITGSNITHWSMRKKVLFGEFEYQEYGLLDNTHLHFFTPKTFKKLITDAGYTIEDYKIDSVGGGFPKVSLLLSKFFPNLFTYQMVIEAKPL